MKNILSLLLLLLFETAASDAVSSLPSLEKKDEKENTVQNLRFGKKLVYSDSEHSPNIVVDDKAIFAQMEESWTPIGLSFSRNFKKVPDQLYIFAQLEGSHCKLKDTYGSNNCFYNWGENLNGLVKMKQEITIDETYEIQGIFKLKKVIDWSFTCAACGESCDITIPIIEKEFSFPTPSCPFAPKKGQSEMISKSFSLNLPKDSPTQGVKLPLEGSVFLKSKVDGSIMAEIFVDITAK